jgi:hypothetical protein
MHQPLTFRNRVETASARHVGGIGKRPDIAIAEERSSFSHAAWVSSIYARYAAIIRGELALARYLLELNDAA